MRAAQCIAEGSCGAASHRRLLIPLNPAGRAGVPMEVMGLMLGEFVDDYTVRVVDVFAMPQSGTGVSVEAVDPVFQTRMLDMLKQVGRWAGATGMGGSPLHGGRLVRRSPPQTRSADGPACLL